MYEELVHDLRLHHDTVVETYSQDGINITETVYSQAANAIEELCKPYWIPVTERLPKNQRPVLVCVPPYTDGVEEYVGYVGMAYFTDTVQGGFWCGTDGNVYGAI